MTTLLANDSSVIRAEITLPIRGAPTARLWLADNAKESRLLAASAVALLLDNKLTLNMSCVQQGQSKDRQDLLAVGGKGSLNTAVTLKQYRDVPPQLLVREAAPAEETTRVDATTKVPNYIRQAGTVADELDSLVRVFGDNYNWRVNAEGKLAVVREQWTALAQAEDLEQFMLRYDGNAKHGCFQGDVRFRVGGSLPSYGKIVRVLHKVGGGFTTEMWFA